MKKVIALLLSVATMSTMLLACSSQPASNSGAAESGNASNKVTIKWFQFQIENATQVKTSQRNIRKNIRISTLKLM